MAIKSQLESSINANRLNVICNHKLNGGNMKNEREKNSNMNSVFMIESQMTWKMQSNWFTIVYVFDRLTCGC